MRIKKALEKYISRTLAEEEGHYNPKPFSPTASKPNPYTSSKTSIIHKNPFLAKNWHKQVTDTQTVTKSPMSNSANHPEIIDNIILYQSPSSSAEAFTASFIPSHNDCKPSIILALNRFSFPPIFGFVANLVSSKFWATIF